MDNRAGVMDCFGTNAVGHVAIFDSDDVLLQWLGRADSNDEAIRIFCEESGMAEGANVDLLVAKVSDEQAAQLRVWNQSGARAPDFPVGIKQEFVDGEHVAKLTGSSSSKNSAFMERIPEYEFLLGGGEKWVSGRRTWPDSVRLKIPRNRALEFALEILRSLRHAKPGEDLVVEKTMLGRLDLRE